MQETEKDREGGQTGETVSYKAYRDMHRNTRDVIRSRQPERVSEKRRERRVGETAKRERKSERRGRQSERRGTVKGE